MLIKRIQHVLVRARVDPLLTQKRMVRSDIRRGVVRQRHGHQLEPLLLLVKLVLRAPGQRLHQSADGKSAPGNRSGT